MRVGFCRPIKPLAVLPMLTLVFVLTGLSGCARMNARPLDPAQSAAALRAKNFNDPRLQRFLSAMGARPPDPSGPYGVRALVLTALYERPDMALASGQVALARAKLTTARALPNPVLSLTPSYNATDGLPSPLKIGPIIDFVIGSFGARQATIGAAAARYQAARQLIEQAMWRERARVRDALMADQQARQRVALAAQARALANWRTSLLASRYQHGMVAAPALMQAQLGQAQARLRWTQAKRSSALAQAALAASLGVSPASVARIRLDRGAIRPVKEGAALQAAVMRAMQDRPSIIAALARYRAAQDQLRAAIDEQFPGVTLGPGYHYDQGQNKYLLDFSLPLPIFNQNQGPIAQARAQRRIAAAQFAAAQERVLAQIRRARADWTGSNRSLAAAASVMAVAVRNGQNAQVAFDHGAIGKLRLIAARQTMLMAQSEMMQARAARWRAAGRLEDALHVILWRGRSG
jgi:outer membrane protein TolC